MNRRGNGKEPRCSFCKKRQDQVRRLIHGPGVNICDECVELCNDILEEDLPPRKPPPPSNA